MPRLALLQMLVTPGDIRANCERALTQIRAAADQGAEIILLPEALPCGWTDPSCQVAAQPIPDGQFCRDLRAAAKRCGVFICSGVVERDHDQVFNSAVIIDSRGEVILVHRKLYELEIAHGCYAPGDRLGIAETRFGRIGVIICADGFVPNQVIARTLGLMGAQLILSPCAWAVPPTHDNRAEPYGKLWLDNYCPVAREFDLWIAGCSNVGLIRAGAWAGHKCIGCSLVVGPGGKETLRGRYGDNAEELLLLDIELKPSRRPAAD